MSRLIDLIEIYDSIVIFRHQIPDMDALGSQWGLYTWLKETYPNKKVYVVGKHVGVKPELFKAYDTVSDEIMSQSLAIILDTANAARVDDVRYTLAQYRLKIDHHPFGETFADEQIIDEQAASTSELIAQLIRDKIHPEILSYQVAQYLYIGIVSDSVHFTTSNTSYKTLSTAAYLAMSPINLSQINEDVFALDRTEFNFSTYIRQHAQMEDCGLVYIIITQAILKECHISVNLAKERINELSGIKDFEVWAMFVQQEEDGHLVYNGSLRSKRIQVNDIAMKYNGGGHKLAAAVKKLQREDIESVLSEIRRKIHDTLFAV
jgi:phosphoesterase RecJ-like protein